MKTRTLYKHLWKDLVAEKSMILLSGPRQVGKTTFMKNIVGADYPNKNYFNWDIIDNKKVLINDPYFFQTMDLKDSSKPLVVLDEIHKYRLWKDYLKGVYDKFHDQYVFAVLGSGRLDINRKAGDALTGRFLEMHLFPFTIAELLHAGIKIDDFLKDPFMGIDHIDVRDATFTWELLFNLGGFPEPFLSGKQSTWRRWSTNYGQQIIRNDIRSLTDVKLIEDIETLFSLLPSRVGSPMSMNNLAKDMQVSFPSVKSWLNLFDHFYLTFRLSPWATNISRSILKEKKVYLFNYPLIQDPSMRFENMVALELYRAVRSWNEWGWGDFGLSYLRNKEKKEVDFLITNNKKPIFLIEAKLSDTSPASSLLEFQAELKVPAIQLVNGPATTRKVIKGKNGKIGVFSASTWLATLP